MTLEERTTLWREREATEIVCKQTIWALAGEGNPLAEEGKGGGGGGEVRGGESSCRGGKGGRGGGERGEGERAL